MAADRERDSQRKRVYDAEDKAGAEVGKPIYGQTIANADLQGYVDSVLQHRAVQARWGQRTVKVVLSHGGGSMYAPAFGRPEIRLGVRARNEQYILHEIAHVLAPAEVMHGPAFTGIYHWLVKTFLGEERGAILREQFRQHRVKVAASTSCIPAPTRTVVTKADRARKATEAKRQAAREETAKEMTSLRRDYRVDTVRRLRHQIKHGLFGPAGSAGRKAALATVRALESNEAAQAARVARTRFEEGS